MRHPWCLVQAHWYEISTFTGFSSDGFVPGKWLDPEFGNVSGYFSGSVTIVNGEPRAVFPTVFASKPGCAGVSSPSCHMEYQVGARE